MEEIKEAVEVHQFCKNVDHWGEMILFGKCKLCGGEIAIRKSDIPMLARDIEFGQMVQSHDCKQDEWASGPCEHPSHAFELVEHEPQTESAAYREAHS